MAVDTALADVSDATHLAPHPLDPLSGAEIEACAAVIAASEHATATLRFVMISLAEPPKQPDLTFDAVLPARRGFVVAYDNAAKMVYEAVVDLDEGAVDSWTPVPGRFPSYLAEHMDGVEKVVREDPRWQEVLRRSIEPG